MALTSWATTAAASRVTVPAAARSFAPVGDDSIAIAPALAVAFWSGSVLPTGRIQTGSVDKGRHTAA
jgi:hypothetical protein